MAQIGRNGTGSRDVHQQSVDVVELEFKGSAVKFVGKNRRYEVVERDLIVIRREEVWDLQKE